MKFKMPITHVALARIAQDQSRPSRLADITISDKYVRSYIGPDDPPASWYMTFSSAAYTASQTGKGWDTAYVLTPVIGKPVYTFDTTGEFIESARDIHIKLFTQHVIVPEASMYRVRRGPAMQHCLYRLGPRWAWKMPLTERP